jgi:archaeal flagellar protein FlaJ
MKTEKRILFASAGVFLVLVILAIAVSKNIAASVNIVLLGILILTVPYSVYKFLQFRKLKSYEDEFPDFLRDVADAQKAGLTILQAIRAASKAEYGLLTGEIRKMDKQLSWNVPLSKVLRKFAERMNESRTIVRSVMIIEQANKTGGNIEEAMEALAANI